MRKIFLIFLVLSLPIVGCRIRSDPYQYEQLAPTQINKSLLLDLHNKQRRYVRRLRKDIQLEQAAQRHAEWMARRSTLRHSNLRNLRVNYVRLGENIAEGSRDEIMVTKAWMQSRHHRENILNRRFTHVGFGYAVSSSGRPYWCAIFGG